MPESSGSTVTVTDVPRGVRAVHVAGQIFPVGEPVSDVSAETIDALERTPGVNVDVAGKPDADTPEPVEEE